MIDCKKIKSLFSFLSFDRFKQKRLERKCEDLPESLKAEALIIARSGFFDIKYYLKQSPDVKKNNIDPIVHFVQYGWKEGRNPSEKFNTNYYLNAYNDVRIAKMNPLAHYIEHGALEGRACDNFITYEDSIRTYENWIRNFEPSPDTYPLYKNISRKWDKKSFISAIPILRKWNRKPLISIIMPIYNTPEDWLRKAIESVINQVYENWELCIVDDASTELHVKEILKKYSINDARIKVVYRKTKEHISEASNSALALATGTFAALLGHEDELHPLSLYFVAETINSNPEAMLIYSDEDKIDKKNIRKDPYFKCEFNYDLLLSHNMISHLGVYKTQLIRDIGGFRSDFVGAHDYDLTLRFVEKIAHSQISHIPRVLYHRRVTVGSDMMSNKLNLKLNSYCDNSNSQRIYHISNNPLVSIVVPFKDKSDLLKKCLNSILNKSTYRNFEVIGISNNSTEKQTFDLMSEFEKRDDRIKFHELNIPFNYSRINNIAIKEHAKGEHVILLNNDIEIITPAWIDALLEFSQREDVGAVGAKLYYPDDTIQHAGVIIGICGLAGHSHKGYSRHSRGYCNRLNLVQNLSAVTAALLMVERKIYLELGGLEEDNLTVAFNDVDFCLRLREKGYLNVFTPYCEAYHYESVSRGYEISKEQKKRFNAELFYCKKRHKDILERGDPFYSPNLTLDSEDFSIAWPPRISNSLEDL